MGLAGAGPLSSAKRRPQGERTAVVVEVVVVVDVVLVVDRVSLYSF